MKAILLAVSSLCVGCAVDEPPEGYAPTLGTPESPIPMDDSYAVQTRVQVVAEVPPAVASLRSFSQAAGHALIARSSVLQSWISTLPTTLRGNLPGYIDAELDKVKLGTKTLRQVAGEIATMTETSLATFTIEPSGWRARQRAGRSDPDRRMAWSCLHTYAEIRIVQVRFT